MEDEIELGAEEVRERGRGMGTYDLRARSVSWFEMYLCRNTTSSI